MAQHVSFDEVMHDLADKPPNARLLASLPPHTTKVLDTTFLVPDLDVSISPFLQLQKVCVHLDLTAEHPFSLSFCSCNHMRCAYLADIHQQPIGFSLRSAWRQLLGSYVVSINNTPIFTTADIDQLLSSLQRLDSIPTTVELVLAPDRSSAFDNHPPPLHLHLHDLHHIHALQSMRE